MKKLQFAIVFCLFCSAAVFVEEAGIRETLTGLLDAETAGQLLSKGSVLTYKYKNADMSPAAAPRLPLIRKIGAVKRKTDKKPAFLIENLYLYKKETDKKVDSSKILRSVSKLEGLQYYSHSRQAMRTFYKKSYAVKETVKGVFEKIADPIEGPADGLTVLAQQEDLTFGNYRYEYGYFQDGNDTGLICVNTETLKYSVFKVIAPYNLQVTLTVHDLDGYLLVYCSTAADFTRLPGLEKKLKNSFSARSQALYDWFIHQYKITEKET